MLHSVNKSKSNFSKEDHETPKVNYLTGDFHKELSSDSDSDSQDVEEKSYVSKGNRLPNPLMGDKLPPPSFSGQTEQSSEGSVFQNQYYTAEATKHSILEQHVKMTSTVIQETTGKKKICWNFKKGKCSFGRKCKYSHGSEIVSPGGEVGQEKPMTNTQYGQNTFEADFQVAEEEDEDSYMAGSKRKNRAGVNDALVPSKKAMKSINKFRKQDSPWTV